jgi:hypothetical protein
MADLITSTYFTNCMAAARVSLSAAQLVVAPQLITTASRMVRKQCNRIFTRQNFDHLFTVDAPSRAVLLREFPVNGVLRCCTNPTTVITISNTDTATNQRATVALAATGDADVGLVPAGLTLTRIASGVTTAVSLPFSANVTIQALANAAIALGAGWTATVEPAFALWPTADLRSVQGVLPALGAGGAGFKIHVDDIPFTLDNETGELVLDDGGGDDPFTSIRFGPFLSTDYGDVQVYGGFQGLRVISDANPDTAYEDVQQATVEVTSDLLNVLSLDQRLESESGKDYSYKINTAAATYAFTRSVLGKLSPYVSHRA